MPSKEFFALAAGYSNNRYLDLKFNQAVWSINVSDLLVKPKAAMEQLIDESGSSHVPAPDPTADPVQDPDPVPPPVINKHFYMSAKLDNVRINKDVNNYVKEIIQHLNAVDGVTVELKLEVEVTAPTGIPDSVVRTVSENCRTLRVSNFSFDN